LAIFILKSQKLMATATTITITKENFADVMLEIAKKLKQKEVLVLKEIEEEVPDFEKK